MPYKFNPFTGNFDLAGVGATGRWIQEYSTVPGTTTLDIAHTPIYRTFPPAGDILLGLKLVINSNRVGTTGVRNFTIDASITTAGEIRYSKSGKNTGQVASQYTALLVNSNATIDGVLQSTVALRIQNFNNESQGFIVEKLVTYRENN